MKKIILIAVSIVAVNFSLYAQRCNVVLFTEQGERFTAILNGARQNNQPETQVKITDLNAEFYKLKVIFEDPQLGAMDNTLYLAYGTERTFSIKKNKKGEYVMRPVSESPLAQLPPPVSNQTVVVYNPNPAPVQTQVNTGVTVTETTTNNTVVGSPNNVSMGINMGGVGLNMNVNVNDGMGYGGASSTTTTTTYSTTSTNAGGAYVNPAPQTTAYVLPGYNGPVGCPLPMSPQDFNNAKNTISSKSFEDSKLQIAKQIINSNCLLSSQVKEIMMLFDFENSKLGFAKYAYGYTFDLGNYYQVNDAFDFESSITDLNNYIKSK